MGSSVFLLIFALLAVVHTERNFRFFIDIFEFENADWKVFETLNSQLVQLNNRSFVSGSWTLRHSVSRFEVRAFIDLINTNNQRKRIFEVRVDGCKFLTRDHKRFLFRVITKTIQKHASANLMCPLQSHMNYTVTNLYLNEQDFPGFVPECKFQGSFEFLWQRKVVTRLQLKGGVNRI